MPDKLMPKRLLDQYIASNFDHNIISEFLTEMNTKEDQICDLNERQHFIPAYAAENEEPENQKDELIRNTFRYKQLLSLNFSLMNELVGPGEFDKDSAFKLMKELPKSTSPYKNLFFKPSKESGQECADMASTCSSSNSI